MRLHLLGSDVTLEVMFYLYMTRNGNIANCETSFTATICDSKGYVLSERDK